MELSGASWLTLGLVGVGVWFLIEGAIYALAPAAMRRFLDWAARLPVKDLRASGVWTAALGALLIYVAIRLI